MEGNKEEILLIKEVLGGNKKAFEQLLHRYEGLVLHIVTPLIGDGKDREDICQEIFIKVYEKLGTFQFRSKLSTWIGRIAYNCSINFLKKKQSIQYIDLSTGTAGLELQDTVMNKEYIMIGKEHITLLMKAIDKLPGIQKTILLLFHLDEQSLEEISGLMEMPINTVKSHLLRARKSLKEMLT